MTVEIVRRWTPDETGCCLICRRGRETHDVEDRCPVRLPQPRTLRHFVTRGGELVEIESVIKETR